MPHPTRDPLGRPQLRLIEGERPAAPAGTGRHALDEDAVLTPIFATLARRRGRPAPPADPVDRFRPDPLTAPIPLQSPAPARRPAHLRAEPEHGGRHHLRRLPTRH